MFDAPEYAKAFEPPTFKDLDGKVYVGRLLGAHSWFKLQPSLRLVGKDGEVDHKQIELATYRIVQALFPTPWWAPWRSVARKVWKLPPLMRVRAVWDFTGSQARWLGLPAQAELPGKFQAATPSSGAPASPSAGSPTPGA